MAHNNSNSTLIQSNAITNLKRIYNKPYKWSLSDFELHPKAISSTFHSQVYHGRYKYNRSRHVAIKVWDKHQLSKPQNSDYRNAVLQERRILSTLSNSKWIASLHMSFIDTHNLYIVMDLCTGRQICCNPSAAPYYASEILTALEWLHFQHGIIHGDLKPSNILVYKNTIKLIDFGAAFVASENKTSLHSSAMGTADYVAPEVLTGKSDCDHISYLCSRDLWSFGCIIYFLYIGESPFHAETDYLAMEKILSFNPSALLLRSIIPPMAQHVIQSLLTRHPVISRLGAMDHKCDSLGANEYTSLRNLPFFSPTNKVTPSDLCTNITRRDSGPMVDGATCGLDFFAV